MDQAQPAELQPRVAECFAALQQLAVPPTHDGTVVRLTLLEIVFGTMVGQYDSWLRTPD